MIRFIFKKQLISSLCIFGCLVSTVGLGINMGYQNDLRYIDVQKQYMEAIPADELFERLNTDVLNSERIVNSIMYYEEYENKNEAQDIVNSALVAGGLSNYIDLDMIKWKEKMLAMPGAYADTVHEDAIVLRELYERLRNQMNFEQIISNRKELIDRGIRRNDGNLAKYLATGEQIKKINMSFSCRDVFYTDNFLTYVESDILPFVACLLMFFGTFSSLVQKKTIRPIFISHYGIRRYTFSQLFSAVVTVLLLVPIYYFTLACFFGHGNLASIAWELPIQAIVGYENVIYPFSVLEYVVVAVLTKTLCCFVVSSLVLLISMLSRNGIVSMSLSLLIVGITSAIVKLGAGDTERLTSMLCGSIQQAVSGTPYFAFGDITVSYLMLYIMTLGICFLNLFVLMVFVAYPTAKRQVSICGK